MANLRKAARGKECQIRIPNICNGDAETTIGAHYRLSGLCGTGMKPNDLLIADSCSACHAEVDRVTQHTDYDYARLCHAEGVFRTLDLRLKEGKIKI